MKNKGWKRKRIKEVLKINDEVYEKLLHATQIARLKKPTRYDPNSVIYFAKQGYSIGDIALTLNISIDECRKRYLLDKIRYGEHTTTTTKRKFIKVKPNEDC